MGSPIFTVTVATILSVRQYFAWKSGAGTIWTVTGSDAAVNGVYEYIGKSGDIEYYHDQTDNTKIMTLNLSSAEYGEYYVGFGTYVGDPVGQTPSSFCHMEMTYWDAALSSYGWDNYNDNSYATPTFASASAGTGLFSTSSDGTNWSADAADDYIELTGLTDTQTGTLYVREKMADASYSDPVSQAWTVAFDNGSMVVVPAATQLQTDITPYSVNFDFPDYGSKLLSNLTTDTFEIMGLWTFAGMRNGLPGFSKVMADASTIYLWYVAEEDRWIVSTAAYWNGTSTYGGDSYFDSYMYANSTGTTFNATGWSAGMNADMGQIGGTITWSSAVYAIMPIGANTARWRVDGGAWTDLDADATTFDVALTIGNTYEVEIQELLENGLYTDSATVTIVSDNISAPFIEVLGGTNEDANFLTNTLDYPANVACWYTSKLNEVWKHKSATVIESSGNGDDATIVDPKRIFYTKDGLNFLTGNQSYLSIPSSPNFAVGTGDFCIIAWVNFMCTDRRAIFAGGSDFWLGMELNQRGARNLSVWASSTGGSWDILQGDSDGANCGNGQISMPYGWNLVMFQRRAGVLQSLVNGVIDVEVANAAAIITKDEVKRIGQWGNGGYSLKSTFIDDFRFINGQSYSEAEALAMFKRGKNYLAPVSEYTDADGLNVNMQIYSNNELSGFDGTSIDRPILWDPNKVNHCYMVTEERNRYMYFVHNRDETGAQRVYTAFKLPQNGVYQFDMDNSDGGYSYQTIAPDGTIIQENYQDGQAERTIDTDTYGAGLYMWSTYSKRFWLNAFPFAPEPITGTDLAAFVSQYSQDAIGVGIYRYRINGGTWSAEFTETELSSMLQFTTGANVIEVQEKSSNGIWGKTGTITLNITAGAEAGGGGGDVTIEAGHMAMFMDPSTGEQYYWDGSGESIGILQQF